MLLFLLPLPERWQFSLSVAAISIFLTVVAALALKATPFTVGAVGGDQRFYAAYVAKYAHFPTYVDGLYRDLPSFYPPLFFYLLGRLAAWLGVEPVYTMKWGLLVTVFLLPFALTALWRRLVDVRLAVAGALALLVYQQWYKPAEWLTMTLFVPWWLIWVERAVRQRHWGWILVGGVIGALLFQTYYYWFLIGGISLGLGLVARLTRLVEEDVVAYGRNAAVVLGCTALFSSPYWAPYLYSMMQTGGWEVLQTRWLSAGKIALPLPFTDDSLEGAVLAAGLLYLGVTARENAVSRGLLSLVIALYVWTGLGYVGMLTDHPLLTFRAFPLIDYLLGVAAFLGLLRLWREAGARRFWPQGVQWLPRLGATAAVILLLFYGAELLSDLQVNDDFTVARAATMPSDRLAALDTLTQGHYQDRVALLGLDHSELLAYRPLFTFLPWSAHYSHPAGHFQARAAFLEKLATIQHPPLFAAALMNNRYDPIDYLLLTPDGRTWRMRYLDDNFPDRTIERRLSFAEQNLTAPYFEARREGSETLIAPVAAQNPGPALAADTAPESDVETAALRVALAGAFGTHLNDTLSAIDQAAAEAALLQADLTTLPPTLLVDLAQAAQGELRERVRQALVAQIPQPLSIDLNDQNGVPKLRLLGYSLQPYALDQNVAELALYFEPVAPLDHDYGVWLHADQAGTQHNLDHWPNLRTTAWQPGTIYRHTHVLELAPGEYTLTFGFWESTQDVRLVQPTGDVGVSLGTHPMPGGGD
jgi:galactan 5-O-arabinofuranosyltransferase